MDLTPRPLGENEMEPSRRAAYDAVNELIRQDPEARMWRAVAVALAAALPIERRAGREDAAKALMDSRKSDSYICRNEAAAVARGQQPREEPWQRRAAATGGGPCPTCRRPFWTHVCLSCSPDYQTPGEGCVNCRNSGMDQTPCKPAVDSIASQHTQDGVR